jgi:hypothetical protein
LGWFVSRRWQRRRDTARGGSLPGSLSRFKRHGASVDGAHPLMHMVGLRCHHCVDVLVRHRRLVDHGSILAALAAGRRWLKRRFASLRDIARPAPCEHERKDSGLPRPRTMNDFAPIEPEMMASSPRPVHRALWRNLDARAEMLFGGDVAAVHCDLAGGRHAAAVSMIS